MCRLRRLRNFPFSIFHYKPRMFPLPASHFTLYTSHYDHAMISIRFPSGWAIQQVLCSCGSVVGSGIGSAPFSAAWRNDLYTSTAETNHPGHVADKQDNTVQSHSTPRKALCHDLDPLYNTPLPRATGKALMPIRQFFILQSSASVWKILFQ